MSTIAFFPATWNLAETTRTIEVAKACKDEFEISFGSYGGQFEQLVESEGFPLTRLEPRLTDDKIEHLYKVDQGEKLGQFFSLEETRHRVNQENEFSAGLESVGRSYWIQHYYKYIKPCIEYPPSLAHAVYMGHSCNDRSRTWLLYGRSGTSRD